MGALNVGKIVEIAQRSELARVVLKALSEMGKSRPTTDIHRFKVRLSEDHGKDVSSSELLEVFKAFQDAGLGKLILSRQLSRAPHRFQWSVNNVEVGRAGVSAPNGAVQAGGHSHTTGHVVSTGAVLEGAVVLSYPLRGRLYSIQLPPDLSKKEAGELCAFISRFGR